MLLFIVHKICLHCGSPKSTITRYNGIKWNNSGLKNRCTSGYSYTKDKINVFPIFAHYCATDARSECPNLEFAVCPIEINVFPRARTW